MHTEASFNIRAISSPGITEWLLDTNSFFNNLTFFFVKCQQIKIHKFNNLNLKSWEADSTIFFFFSTKNLFFSIFL